MRSKVVDRRSLINDDAEVRSNIRWDDGEVELLAEALLAMREIDPVSNVGSMIAPIQEVLPENRRRKGLSSAKQIPQVMARLKALMDARACLVAKASQPPPPSPPPPPTPAEILASVGLPELLAQVCLRLSGLSADVIRRLEAMEGDMKQFKTEVMGHIRPSNGYHTTGPVSAGPQHRPFATDDKPPAKPSAIKVCVVGLLSGQQQEAKRKCPKGIELVFVSQDAHEPRFPNSADFIVLIKKFTKHKWSTAALQARDRNRVFMIDGCVSSLVKKLEDIAQANAPSQKT